jgi:MFS family permease
MKNNKKLILLSIISVLGIFTGGLFAPFEMIFIKNIAGNDTFASFAFTIGIVASIIGTMWITYLANVYGRRKILLIAMFVAIFPPIAYVNINNLLQLYSVKFAWVVALAGAGTIMGAVLQREVVKINTKPGSFYGILYSVQSAAGSLGTIAGGYISDKLGYTVVFYTVAFLLIVQFLVFLTIFYSKETEKTEEQDSKQKKSIKEAIIFIWHNSQLRLRFILGAAFGVGWGTKAILYPLIFVALTGANTVTGAVMSSQGIAAMIILPIIGKIVDKFGYSRVLWFGYVTLGISQLMFGVGTQLWIVWLAAIMTAIGEACNGPAMSALEVKTIPEHLRNSIIAVQTIFGITVEIIATSGIGILLSYVTPQDVMRLISSIVFIALVLAMVNFKADKTKKGQRFFVLKENSSFEK